MENLDSVPVVPVIVTEEFTLSAFEDERKEIPEYKYMTGLAFEARRWAEAGNTHFEERVLTTLMDFIQEYLDAPVIEGKRTL